MSARTAMTRNQYERLVKIHVWPMPDDEENGYKVEIDAHGDSPPDSWFACETRGMAALGRHELVVMPVPAWLVGPVAAWLNHWALYSVNHPRGLQPGERLMNTDAAVPVRFSVVEGPQKGAPLLLRPEACRLPVCAGCGKAHLGGSAEH